MKNTSALAAANEWVWGGPAQRGKEASRARLALPPWASTHHAEETLAQPTHLPWHP